MAKRCEIGPRLLLIANRKSHTGLQITLALSLTVSEMTTYSLKLSIENCGQIAADENMVTIDSL